MSAVKRIARRRQESKEAKRIGWLANRGKNEHAYAEEWRWRMACFAEGMPVAMAMDLEANAVARVEDLEKRVDAAEQRAADMEERMLKLGLIKRT